MTLRLDSGVTAGFFFAAAMQRWQYCYFAALLAG
jgi:hypothetical protein